MWLCLIILCCACAHMRMLGPIGPMHVIRMLCPCFVMFYHAAFIVCIMLYKRSYCLLDVNHYVLAVLHYFILCMHSYVYAQYQVPIICVMYMLYPRFVNILHYVVHALILSV